MKKECSKTFYILSYLAEYLQIYKNDTKGRECSNKYMKKSVVVVNSECGLHARPASMLVSTAMKFSSDIRIKKDEKTANCKSILSILSIGASDGDEVEIIVEGQDEADAFKTIKSLFDCHFAHA